MVILVALGVWLMVAIVAYSTVGKKEKIPEKKKNSIYVTCDGCSTIYEKSKSDRGLLFECEVCTAKWNHPVLLAIWEK